MTISYYHKVEQNSDFQTKKIEILNSEFYISRETTGFTDYRFVFAKNLTQLQLEKDASRKIAVEHGITGSQRESAAGRSTGKYRQMSNCGRVDSQGAIGCK